VWSGEKLAKNGVHWQTLGTFKSRRELGGKGFLELKTGQFKVY
jgi:hypothetical protein